MKSTLQKQIATAVMVLAPLGGAFIVQPAAAEPVSTARGVAQAPVLRVTNMSLNSDAGLAPGATLRLLVHATPRADWAHVTLGDSGVRVALSEREPGEYVGTHVIRRGERIDPRDTMTVRAGWRDRATALAFNYPPSFQALVMGAAPAVVVNSFTMSPSFALKPGQVVTFRVHGTPRAAAWVNVPNVVRDLAMREVRPGVYEARYTVRRQDRSSEFREAKATLRNGHQRATAEVNTGRPAYSYGYGR